MAATATGVGRLWMVQFEEFSGAGTENVNYRHAYHAGNHTEVFKHAVLALLLNALKGKSKPFAVLDTHAGIGLYDLRSPEAERTRESDDGVARLAGVGLRSAPGYMEVVRATAERGPTLYPGSPEIVRSLIRDGDRALLCELHPDDVATLRRRYRGDDRVSVHFRNGYEAIDALLPPAERRGLVFVDPPFEARDETRAIEVALRRGRRRWASGIFMVWYPVKTALIGDEIERGAVRAGFGSILRAEFCPYVRDGERLAGGGIVICNPPWSIDDRMRDLCRELSLLLGDGAATWSVEPVRVTEAS